MRLEVHYTDKYTDDAGIEWLVINGDTAFPTSEWTEEDAIAYYTSEEYAEEHWESLYSMWCD